MKETFSNNLKQFRKQKQLSQEQLAEQLGITTQAVSKWECSLSYPDIDLLPQLADLFGVSIDTLLRGDAACAGADGGASDHAAKADQPEGTNDATGNSAAEESTPFPQPDLPDDDVLRIVQYRGKTLLRKDTYDPNIRIPLSLTCEPRTKKFFFGQVSFSMSDSNTASTPIEIWGSADIFGDLNGSANIGASVTCSGDINGTVNTGMNVQCSGDINGDANAGQNITCDGDINGDASAGSNLSCDGDINGDGNISAGGDLSCNGDIACDGNISADGNLSCGGDIACDGNITTSSELSCGGDINCDGNVSAQSSVTCGGDLNGDVSAGGSITCNGDIS